MTDANCDGSKEKRNKNSKDVDRAFEKVDRTSAHPMLFLEIHYVMRSTSLRLFVRFQNQIIIKKKKKKSNKQTNEKTKNK
jgi:hypothetical protein